MCHLPSPRSPPSLLQLQGPGLWVPEQCLQPAGTCLFAATARPSLSYRRDRGRSLSVLCHPLRGEKTPGGSLGGKRTPDLLPIAQLSLGTECQGPRGHPPQPRMLTRPPPYVPCRTHPSDIWRALGSGVRSRQALYPPAITYQEPCGVLNKNTGSHRKTLTICN